MGVATALLGAGRIGLTHARAMSEIANLDLVAIYDPIDAAAEAAVGISGAARRSLSGILGDETIAAVVIATPTDLHAELIEAAARAGKAIFCEKPIDLDASRVRDCLEVVEIENAQLMVGFNRRFDPHFRELRQQIGDGVIGKVEIVIITSRDPAPPPLDYIRRSGGLFRDMMIHDFDMARFLLDEEISEVSAVGSVLIEPEIGVAGDVDTATATLSTATGKICLISCSRRATYGYDQRVEVHGSKGMVSADNLRATTVSVGDAAGFRSEPLLDFFMERYRDAYRIELSAFADAISSALPMSPTGRDGLKALELADAAVTSAAEGRRVKP